MCYRQDGDRGGRSAQALPKITGLDAVLVDGHEGRDIDTQNAGDVDELSEVETPLPSFVLGDEALGPAEGLGNLYLGKPGDFPRLDHHRSEELVLGAVQRIDHPHTLITHCGISRIGIS